MRKMLLAATALVGLTAFAHAASGPVPANTSLGGYVSYNPNGNDSGLEATFQSQYDAYTASLGERPRYWLTFGNYGDNFANTGDGSLAAAVDWNIWSMSQTPVGYLSSAETPQTIPVITIPMVDNEPSLGWGNVDAGYLFVTAGNADNFFKSVPDSCAAHGFKTCEFRIGHEWNGNWYPWGPGNAPNQGTAPNIATDFIAAWRHIATVMKTECAVKGITCRTVWNPAELNWNAWPVENFYPGDDVTDVISVDLYGPLPERTPGSGVSAGMDELLTFAKAHGKAFAISETAATQSSSGDPTFPAYLAGKIAAYPTVPLDHVAIWDAGAWAFTSDANPPKPAEAAAWQYYFGPGQFSVTNNGVTPTPPPPPPPPPPPVNTLTVKTPVPLMAATDAIIGAETDPTQGVFLEWAATAPAVGSGWTAATVASDGTFSAQVPVGPAGTAKTMFAYAGTSAAASSVPVTAEFTGTPTSTAPPGDTIVVNQPSPLISGVQPITGTDTDSSQSVFLDWRNVGVPALSAGDWFQATVTGGTFSASVNIDNPGQQGTMYYHVGTNGAVVAAWTATPTAPTPPPPPPPAYTLSVTKPNPLVPGVQTITGTATNNSQPIFLDWNLTAPHVGDCGWVQATVNSDGTFSAQMNLVPAGQQETMFAYAGTMASAFPITAEWSGVPTVPVQNSIVLTSHGNVTHGVPFTESGIYSGSVTLPLKISLDGGATWNLLTSCSACSSVTQGNGVFSYSYTNASTGAKQHTIEDSSSTPVVSNTVSYTSQ